MLSVENPLEIWPGMSHIARQMDENEKKLCIMKLILQEKQIFLAVVVTISRFQQRLLRKREEEIRKNGT